MIPQPVFICDLANNHFGDMKHAFSIIKAIADIKEETQASIAVKFQFRNYDTYIHPDYMERRDLKYIDRFLSTKLEEKDFFELSDLVKSYGLLSMSTPFDEESVDWIDRINVDIIKVASASANDYPLLKRIVKSQKPVVASTGGLRSEEVDRLVFNFSGEVPEFILMHCVSIYPCPSEKLNLRQITYFKERYENLRIGFSTHEDQDDYFPVSLATALGATAFERHVGIDTEKYALNSYSSNPKQLKNWIMSQQESEKTLGNLNRSPSSLEETETLKALKRGVFLRSPKSAGDLITEDDYFSAFPVTADDQLISGEALGPMRAKIDMHTNQAITRSSVDINSSSESDLQVILLQIKTMLSESRVKFNSTAEVELSHHYGIDKFREFGAVLITCYNDEYAKKLVIQLPRQKHPYHHHKLKKESFQLLWGDMELFIDGRSTKLEVGEIVTVQRGEWHKFSTLHGAIVEEISTEAIDGDSYYEDPAIANIPRDKRKTRISGF